MAEVAAQICGIECEHRVLINDIAGYVTIAVTTEQGPDGVAAPPWR